MPNSLEKQREKVWNALEKSKEDCEAIYNTAKEAWSTMDDDSIMAMPKYTITKILMMMAASLGELEYRHQLELARIRDSN